MHAAVAAQAHQVQAMPCARAAWRPASNRIVEELARGDHAVDARHIHMDDAPGADVQMPTSLLPIWPSGKPDGGSGGLHQRVGEIAQQHVVGGLARGGDGVAFDGGEKPQPSRMVRISGLLLAVHYWRNAFRPANFAALPSSLFDAQQAGCISRCDRCGWPIRS
jgi:hypothetical protein